MRPYLIAGTVIMIVLGVCFSSNVSQKPREKTFYEVTTEKYIDSERARFYDDEVKLHLKLNRIIELLENK